MESNREDELPLRQGEMIYVIEKSESGWWKGRCDDGRIGWLPASYLRTPTSQEAQEKKKVNIFCFRSTPNFVFKLKPYLFTCLSVLFVETNSKYS